MNLLPMKKIRNKKRERTQIFFFYYSTTPNYNVGDGKESCIIITPSPNESLVAGTKTVSFNISKQCSFYILRFKFFGGELYWMKSIFYEGPKILMIFLCCSKKMCHHFYYFYTHFCVSLSLMSLLFCFCSLCHHFIWVFFSGQCDKLSSCQQQRNS